MSMISIKEADRLEGWLSDMDYTKVTQALSSTEDFGYFKSVRDEKGELLYQIEFRFWDFRKYNQPNFGVDILILPETSEGRTDLILSYPKNLEDVEHIAEKFYQFIQDNKTFF